MRERLQQIRVAFDRTREVDPRLVPYLAIAFGLGFLVPFLVWWLVLDALLLGVFTGLAFGMLAALVIFNRRVSAAQFEAMEGQPGAAVAVLQSMRGPWHVTPAVAFNRKQDMVHVVVGRPGVVLVGEGSRAGVRTLLKTESRKMRRVVGEDAEVHTVIVGTGEEEVDLRKLRMHVMKLPRNIKKREVTDLERRVSALAEQNRSMPKGPIPQGKASRGMSRRMRRSQGR